MKKLFLFTIVILFAAFAVFPDYAFATTYRVLDEVTGLPEGSEENSIEKATNDYVSIVSGVYYDVQMDAYCYDISGAQKAITANVMKGMVVTEPVAITISDGISYTLFRNGSEYTEEDISAISRAGSYNFNVLVNGISTPVLNFTIVGSVSGTIDSYSLPAGFVLDGVYFNGELIQTEGTLADFTDEGAYIVEYHNYLTDIPYALTVDIDHTPPVLALEAVGEDSIAHGPVDISDIEDGASISIVCNDTGLSYSYTLTEPGNYYIVIQDAAGNTNSYAFTIQVYFNTSSMVFFGIMILLAVLLVVYIFRSRTKTRVR